MALSRGSTNTLELSKFQNAVTRMMPTDAVVTGTLKSTAGVAVTGATNAPMPFEPATDEVPAAYRGIVASTVLLPDAEYDLFVVATWNLNTRTFPAVRLPVE